MRGVALGVWAREVLWEIARRFPLKVRTFSIANELIHILMYTYWSLAEGWPIFKRILNIIL
jgi:hypothetical protein